MDMSEAATAQRVLDVLKQAQAKPAPEALPLLNGLIPLVQGGGEAPLEVEDARAGAFLAICEVGKALHRGLPADGAYAAAISASERWLALLPPITKS
jgi:hypothetical protein